MGQPNCVCLPPPLQSQIAYQIFASINVSSIQSINSTETLASIYGIECNSPSISPPWLTSTTLAIDGYAYKAMGPWTYICYPGIKFHQKKLYPVSTGGIVGIAVGIGIPLVLFIVWFVHRRGNKKIAREVEKRRQARLNGEGYELQDRRHREAPPVYKEEGDGVEGSMRTGEADSGSGVGECGGRGQRPPGYHDVDAMPKEDE
jgi:hypothetical protein